MNRLAKALAVLAVAALGVWGCARGPEASAAQDRIQALETRNARLEEDFRSASAARDQFRRRLTTSETEQSQLRKQVEQLQAVARERDTLRGQLQVRTGERDLLQSQFEQFRKTLREMLGQTETALGPLAQPTIPTVRLGDGPALPERS